MSGKLKKMQFFLVLSPFCYQPMKHSEGKKPNTSDVGPHGWHSWRGCQSLSLMSVSKKMSGKLIIMHVFLGFEPYLLTSSEAECRVAVSASHFKVHMAGTVDVNARVWVSWALAKNERKTNKHSRFSWFWALFVIKQCSRVVGSSLNVSSVGPIGGCNWCGRQNLS